MGDVIGPALLGLIVFHEWQRSPGLGLLYLSLGLVGAVVMSVAR
jgi:glucose uptake protein GlcU